MKRGSAETRTACSGANGLTSDLARDLAAPEESVRGPGLATEATREIPVVREARLRSLLARTHLAHRASPTTRDWECCTESCSAPTSTTTSRRACSSATTDTSSPATQR